MAIKCKKPVYAAAYFERAKVRCTGGHTHSLEASVWVLGVAWEVEVEVEVEVEALAMVQCLLTVGEPKDWQQYKGSAGFLQGDSSQYQ